MKSAANIVDVLKRRYEVTPLQADVTVLSWAANKVAETRGVAVAASQLRRVNAQRERMGRMPYYPPWGDVLFDAYYERARR